MYKFFWTPYIFGVSFFICYRSLELSLITLSGVLLNLRSRCPHTHNIVRPSCWANLPVQQSLAGQWKHSLVLHCLCPIKPQHCFRLSKPPEHHIWLGLDTIYPHKPVLPHYVLQPNPCCKEQDIWMLLYKPESHVGQKFLSLITLFGVLLNLRSRGRNSACDGWID